MSETFSFAQFNFSGFRHNNYTSWKALGKEDDRELEEVDSLSSSNFEQNLQTKNGHNLAMYQSQLSPQFGILDDSYLNAFSPSPFQSFVEDTTKEPVPFETANKEMMPCSAPFASLRILNNHRYGLGGQFNSADATKPGGKKLSTDGILRLAGEKFIQSFSFQSHGPLENPWLGLTNEEAKGVELVQNLLASAEKVSQQQYDRARTILTQCDAFSSSTGNTVQKIVYHFSEALKEKIDKETGRTAASKGIGKKQLLFHNEEMMSPSRAIIAFHRKLPFTQVFHFTGMQAIIERVTESKRVHLIDLDIRNGLHCVVLMQALATRNEEPPVELLKITAVGTQSRSIIEATGERLASFAKSVNLPFCFKVVMVSEMAHLNEERFQLEDDETVAIYASYSLNSMIQRPDQLEALLRLLGDINPCVVILMEVEGNHNSPKFVNRFVEALFYYGALFDCVEECMDRGGDDDGVSVISSFSWGIRNMVGAEGEERVIRHVNIGVWRSCFARFGLMEEELSTSSLFQASLVVKNFARANCFSFEMDGNCLITGWKGVPLYSLSAWRFK